jgi:hypothetical protein
MKKNRLNAERGTESALAVAATRQNAKTNGFIRPTTRLPTGIRKAESDQIRPNPSKNLFFVVTGRPHPSFDVRRSAFDVGCSPPFPRVPRSSYV